MPRHGIGPLPNFGPRQEVLYIKVYEGRSKLCFPLELSSGKSRTDLEITKILLGFYEANTTSQAFLSLPKTS